MIGRMLGALQLKSATFEAIEADKKATAQALLVVVVVAVVTGLVGLQVADDSAIWGLVLGIVLALVGWAVWAGITYFVGTTIFKTATTHADWGELARVLGFAQTPGLFRILGVIPGIGPIVLIVVAVWQIAAMVVAVRAALDYTSTLRAIGVVLVGFVPYAIFLWVIAQLI